MVFWLVGEEVVVVVGGRKFPSGQSAGHFWLAYARTRKERKEEEERWTQKKIKKKVLKKRTDFREEKKGEFVKKYY